jgi:hypothetical protein
MKEKIVNYLDLMAELPEPQYIHINTGINRRDRRHGYTQTGKHYIIPKEYREPATNKPYVRQAEDNVDASE